MAIKGRHLSTDLVVTGEGILLRRQVLQTTGPIPADTSRCRRVALVELGAGEGHVHSRDRGALVDYVVELGEAAGECELEALRQAEDNTHGQLQRIEINY